MFPFLRFPRIEDLREVARKGESRGCDRSLLLAGLIAWVVLVYSLRMSRSVFFAYSGFEMLTAFRRERVVRIQED